MIIALAFIGAAMLYGCSEESVTPAEEVATFKSHTPEGGISDREDLRDCDR